MMGNVETPGATMKHWHGIRKVSSQERNYPSSGGL